MRIYIIFTTGPFKAYADKKEAYQEYDRLKNLDDYINYSIIDMPVIEKKGSINES